MSTSSDKTVVVAMSGGVDSSVAAALLAQEGYHAIGVTLLFRPCEGEGEELKWCCGVGAAEAARAVCGQLGLPHYAIDCAEVFASQVLETAWREYASGRTPSPCIHCNQQLKFGFLLDLARKLGAGLIATGHYSRLGRDQTTSAPVLLRGCDPGKDQSYFLFALSRDQLEATRFPLGKLTKPEVRALAVSLGLPNATRRESQDACFSHPDGGFAEGLRLRFGAPARQGDFVDTLGRVLGHHSGVHRFTVGQRKGHGVALGERAYVISIDAAANRVVLSRSSGSFV